MNVSSEYKNAPRSISVSNRLYKKADWHGKSGKIDVQSKTHARTRTKQLPICAQTFWP